MSTPRLGLNNGVEMPALGFGVFQTPWDETIAAVAAALQVGYRHVATAAAYGNEREVGEAIRRSGLDRSEVFVETKAGPSLRPDRTTRVLGGRCGVETTHRMCTGHDRR